MLECTLAWSCSARRDSTIRHYHVKLNTNEFSLYPISDVQIGSPGVDEKGFREYIAEGLANPSARFVGVGDYTDGVSPSNRKILTAAFKKGDLYDTPQEMMREAAAEQVYQFANLVRGSEGRWDAVASGHHFWEYVDEGQVRTTDMDIAEHLRAPYIPEGESAVITYTFKNGVPFRVWLRHGEGSGKTFATPLNQLEAMMRAFTADCYIIAHHHKLVAARAVKLSEAEGTETGLHATDSVLVCAGSWMKGYLADYGTYAEKGMLVPLAEGGAVIRARSTKGRLRIRVEI